MPAVFCVYSFWVLSQCPRLLMLLHRCIKRKSAGLQSHNETPNVPIRAHIHVVVTYFVLGKPCEDLGPININSRSLGTFLGTVLIVFSYEHRLSVFTCSFLISFLRSASYFSFWFALAAL